MTNQVTKKEKFSYGGFFLGQNVFYAMVAGFLMIYYTEVVGLNALDIGVMFAVARLWDAINDPIMGIIVDKVNLKGGKFMPWLRGVTFLLPIMIILLFSNPLATADYSVKLVYAYVTYIAFGMVYTLSDVPIFAQSTVVSEDVNERTSYLMTGRMFAMLGGLVAIVVFPIVSAKLGLSTTAYILAIVSFFIMLPFVFFGKERIEPEIGKTPSALEMIKTVFTNKYLIIYFGSFLILRGLLVNTISANYFYLFVMGNEKLISIVGLLSIIPGLVLAAVAPKLVKTIGKRKLYITLSVISAISGILLFIVGYNSTLVVIILMTLLGLATTASSIMMGLFVGDCIEYGEYTTGQRNEGLSFSIQTFSNKASTAINALLAGFMLNAIGYVDAASVNAEVSQGLFAMTTIIPAIGIIISILVFIFLYDLSEDRVQEMIEHNNANKE